MVRFSELADDAYVAGCMKRGGDFEFVAKEEIKAFVSDNKESILWHSMDGKNRPSVWATEKHIAKFECGDISDICDDFEERDGFPEWGNTVYDDISAEDKNTICRIFNNAFRRNPVYRATDSMVDLEG